MNNVKFEFVNKYFTAAADTFKLNNDIKKMVSFSFYDILDKHSFVPSESIFADFDIILCRNVLVYFNLKFQEIIFNKLHRSLNSGGFLVLGEAEVPIEKHKSDFRRVYRCCKIYQKK